MSDTLNLMDETRDGVIILHVMTEWLIDPKIADSLTARLCGLIESASCPLVVDLGGVTRMTSIFFRSFIIAGKEAGKRQVRMAFCNVSPTINQGFKIVGLDKLFDLFVNEQEALREMRPR